MRERHALEKLLAAGRYSVMVARPTDWLGGHLIDDRRPMVVVDLQRQRIESRHEGASAARRRADALIAAETARLEGLARTVTGRRGSREADR